MEWKGLVYQGKDYGHLFLISSDGEIKNIVTGVIRKKTINPVGYYAVNVSLGSRESKKTIRVHKAVAETFLHTDDFTLDVNHKDGNKLNNNVENLEWCTHRWNMEHAYKNGLTSQNKKVICLNTGQVFNSILEASRWCGLSANGNSLSDLLIGNNGRKTAGKHPITKEKLRWMYHEEYLKVNNLDH